LRGLVVVPSFTAYDQVSDDLFFVADLPHETAGVIWNLVGGDAEPLWDGVTNDYCLSCLGGHCLSSGRRFLSGFICIGFGFGWHCFLLE